MSYLIIVGVVVIVVVIGLAALASYDCPREILGYNCRGKECDHSPETIAEAKKAMER